MFTKIKSIITNHANQHDALKEAFLESKKSIYQKSEYTMSFKDREFAELKAKYDADRTELYKATKATLDEAFKEVYANIEDVLTAEISQEDIANLAMLENAKVSSFELNAYAKKYSGKYKALRMLEDIATKNQLAFSFVSGSDVIKDINEIRDMAMGFLSMYEGAMTPEYMPRYLLANADDTISEGNRFTILESEINDFLHPVAGVDE